MKLRRVTPRLYVRVTLMMLAAVAFLVGGAVQYSQASNVCGTEETQQGNSCVMMLGGKPFATDESSKISDDHVGGLVLFGLGLLLIVFGMVVIFGIRDFLADQRDEQAELEAAAVADAQAE